MRLPGEDGPTSRRVAADLAVYGVLLLAVFIFYRGALQVYFLNEDFSWLWRCRLAAPARLWTLLTRDVMGGLYSWRPVLQLLFGLEGAVWDTHVLGYRVAALGWHVLAACELYSIGTRLADRRRGALAAVLFALHPLHVESVSWTCAVGGPVATVFVLLAVLGYLRWRRGAGLWRIVVPFALSMATLESSLVLVPLVLAAEVLWPGPAPGLGRRLGLYVALVVVAGAFLELRHLVSPAVANRNLVGFDPRWPLHAGQLAAFVLHKLHTTAALLLTLHEPAGWAPTGIALAVSAAAGVCWWRGRPLGLWGLVWIVVASAPFTLLLLGPYPRHLHLASAGFGLLWAELLATLADILARRSRPLSMVCVAALLVLWLAHMTTRIDQAMTGFIERGRLSQALLADLQRLVPHPRPGSQLAFYRLGDLRARQNVFVFGFDDAVRVLYDDDSLTVRLGPVGMAPDATYQLWYQDGHLVLANGARP